MLKARDGVTRSASVGEGPTQGLIDVAVRIRAFELALLDLFKQGLVSGTVHTCIGQEFCAACLHPHLRCGVDAFFATHRGHGHYLAHSGPEEPLLAELMGREGALCLGRGGTQNLQFERFFSSGIQAGAAPIAVGYAWAKRRLGEEAIAVAQLGDGTLGEGTLYEALTFAALLQSPVLFLLEWNGWAQSTDVRNTTPGDILQRVAGFGIEVHQTDDGDPQALSDHFHQIVARVRQGKPFFQIVHTRRLMAHSKGDDDRPEAFVKQLWVQDPLSRYLNDAPTSQTNTEAEGEITRLARSVGSRPMLEYAELPALSKGISLGSSKELHANAQTGRAFGRIAEELNQAFHELMGEDTRIIQVGEDLADPYGGAFKVTRGLSTAFPGRVLSTPIAEAGIVGISNGMALAGLLPVVEIMFADFATLAADQLINFAAKFHSMYGGRVTCPLTLRLVSGGGRGYGPTHSQSLERIFLGVPGLRVVAISLRHDPRQLLRQVVLNDPNPTILVENKSLYSLRPSVEPPIDLKPIWVDARSGQFPPLVFAPVAGRADVTLVAFGGTTEIAELAMRRLIEEEELRFDYIILTQLWPLDVTEIAASVATTRRLVVVEENGPEFGVGAAIIAGVAQQMNESFTCKAVGSLAVPLPAVRHLEDSVLPSADRLTAAIRSTL